MRQAKEKLPFKVDRALPKSLTQQLVDGFARAIAFGVYKPGDLLPPFRDVAELTGVSEIVARAAFRKLGQMGYVNPRLGVGTIVLDRHLPWKGQVLVVGFDTISDYFHDTIGGILRANLLKAGYLSLQVAVVRDDRGRLGLEMLELVLRQHFSLVVVLGRREQVVECLIRRGVPFVCATADCRDVPGAVGSFSISTRKAIADFAAACRDSGIREICGVSFGEFPRMAELLGKEGIAVDSCRIPHSDAQLSYSELQRKAYDDFERLFYVPARPLPRLVYVSDDYLAASVLASLQAHGIRLPEDMKFVTWINRGAGPFHPRTLARIEADPFEFGRALSDYVIGLVSGGSPKPCLELDCRYRTGDTFPAREA